MSLSVLSMLMLAYTAPYLYSLSCLHNTDVKYYNGEWNISMSGKICKPWSIAKGQYSLEELNLKNYNENFCRNPNRNNSAWCFVEYNSTEKCDIPKCSAKSFEPSNIMLVSPGANYCVVEPRIHFRVCPSFFSDVPLFKDNGLSNVVFCCVSNDTYVNNVLPNNTCLFVVRQASVLKEHFALCPKGFYSLPVTENMLVEGNVIYKCCKAMSPNEEYINIFKNTVIAQANHNTAEPILAYVSLNNELCQPLMEFIIERKEYHEMNKLSNNVLPPKIILCFFYLRRLSSIMLADSHLGFMSLKECPLGSIESNEGMNTFILDTAKLKFCWPQNITHVYFITNICLNTKSVNINTSTLCPQNFQACDILSALITKPFSRLCCRFQADKHTETVTRSINSSISFLIVSETCPNYAQNNSMKGFLMRGLIQMPNLRVHYNKTRIESFPYSPDVSICSYEAQTDEFAYKKIGNHCPVGMFEGNAIFKLINSTKIQQQDQFSIRFCVGNAVYIQQSFPTGKYCVYKISKLCPIGFQSKPLGTKRYIIKKENLIPDYANEALCCRDDRNTNQSALFKYPPFIYPNKTLTFGLLLLENYDVCPSINTFISYLDFDVDGPYCSYRSAEEHYRWNHRIIWPQSVSESTNPNELIKSSLLDHWTSLNMSTYQSSLMVKYPSGDFCMMSLDTCISIYGINFVVKYPVKGFFVCCILRRTALITDVPELSPNWNMASTQLIGYIALHGKCPIFDQNRFLLQCKVHDIFEINQTLYPSNERSNLIKIGVSHDFSSKSKFVKVDFQFCIFQKRAKIEIKKVIEVLSNQRQNIIIGLLISILVFVVALSIYFVLYNRGRFCRLRFSKVNNKRISAIYTQIDSTFIYEEKNEAEDDNASVAYSIIL